MVAYRGGPQSTCLRKRPYRTKKQAKEAVKRMAKAPGGGRLVPYRCGWCHFWHIGHEPRNRKGEE